MRRLLLLCIALFGNLAQAAPWSFDPAIAVTPEIRAGVFVHLESSGRKNIAVSNEWVVISWEDNRDGTPRCYVALKAPGQTTFGTALKISGNSEAAEPAIVSVGRGRFAVAWEEAERVWVRILTTGKAGTTAQLAAPFKLSTNAGAQISLSFSPDNGLYAVWSEQGEKFWQIRLSKLKADTRGSIRSASSVVVDKAAEGDQSYPGIAVLAGGNNIIAWEDRRAGHTRIIYSGSKKDSVYAEPHQLNETMRNSGNPGFGRGTGVMRVALTASGRNDIAAVWSDKRDYQSGYDVYGGIASGDTLAFGKNEKVQDEFGDSFAQWHPANAANEAGNVVVAWDDDRDGSPDIWLSWRNGDGWSSDLAVPGASGQGVQSDPSVAMDESGNLHLAWVEKSELNSPSRIRYTFARAAGRQAK